MKRVLVECRDLFFRGKLQEIVRGAQAEAVRDGPFDLAVVELSKPNVEARIRELVQRGVPVLAFGSHVDAAAVLTILFAAVMTVHPHPVKSVLALVVSFFGLAVCFVMLSAPFIAAIQVIVYAGAILVLFLFVLMLLNVGPETRERDPRPIQRALAGVGLVLFAGMLLGLLRAYGATGLMASAALPGDIAPLARLLFSSYLLPFEALSVLLLAALVGAFVLARRESSS